MFFCLANPPFNRSDCKTGKNSCISLFFLHGHRHCLNQRPALSLQYIYQLKSIRLLKFNIVPHALPPRAIQKAIAINNFNIFSSVFSLTSFYEAYRSFYRSAFFSGRTGNFSPSEGAVKKCGEGAASPHFVPSLQVKYLFTGTFPHLVAKA